MLQSYLLLKGVIVVARQFRTDAVRRKNAAQRFQLAHIVTIFNIAKTRAMTSSRAVDVAHGTNSPRCRFRSR